ncbi:hypothetical protein [Agromyces sp. GXS1127]|uniref:hypothetical protein n=1 Tax=Agromyces sp. GXS1127 TaxID=3424181 RepID=UPI003D320E92
MRGRTDYPGRADDVINPWVIRFDADGRATEFTEWYLRRPRPPDPPQASRVLVGIDLSSTGAGVRVFFTGIFPVHGPISEASGCRWVVV